MALKLPRLDAGIAIVNANGTPTAAFIGWWSKVADLVESHVTELELQAALDAVDTAITAANDAATAANDAATDAQAATDNNARFLSISNSNVTGCTITATDAGANVTVTISAHTRNYADGTSVAVSGGSITALAYSTQYFVAYDDADLSGGAETYVAYTSGPDALTTAAGGAAPDRHYVGSVVTPAALGAPIDGAGAIPPIFDTPIGGNWL